MTDLFPLSITPDEAVFLYRSIRLTFTVSEKSRLLTAVFDNDPTRPHTVADWLHAEEIRDLLVYFCFNTKESIKVIRSGGKLIFQQGLLTVEA